MRPKMLHVFQIHHDAPAKISPYHHRHRHGCRIMRTMLRVDPDLKKKTHSIKKNLKIDLIGFVTLCKNEPRGRIINH